MLPRPSYVTQSRYFISWHKYHHQTLLGCSPSHTHTQTSSFSVFQHSDCRTTYLALPESVLLRRPTENRPRPTLTSRQTRKWYLFKFIAFSVCCSLPSGETYTPCMGKLDSIKLMCTKRPGGWVLVVHCWSKSWRCFVVRSTEKKSGWKK